MAGAVEFGVIEAVVEAEDGLRGLENIPIEACGSGARSKRVRISYERWEEGSDAPEAVECLVLKPPDGSNLRTLPLPAAARSPMRIFLKLLWRFLFSDLCCFSKSFFLTSPLLREDSFLMGNAKSRHKLSVANENSANVISNCKRIQKTAGGRPEEQKFRKSTTTIASAAKYNKTQYQHSLAADDGQQQQQRRLKQLGQENKGFHAST
ncbi:hypothetical protein GQX74_007693 [Glossina fuscipes]|nr:hypothetical protein GQX74_007693 [Glossina fuscipes]